MAFVNLLTFLSQRLPLFQLQLNIIVKFCLRCQLIMIMLQIPVMPMQLSEIDFKVIEVFLLVLFHFVSHLVCELVYLTVNEFVIKIYLLSVEGIVLK